MKFLRILIIILSVIIIAYLVIQFIPVKKLNFGYNFKDKSGRYIYCDTVIEIPCLEEVLERYGNIAKSIEFKDN